MFDFTFDLIDLKSADHLHFKQEVEKSILKHNGTITSKKKEANQIKIKITFQTESDRASFIEALQNQMGKKAI